MITPSVSAPFSNVGDVTAAHDDMSAERHPILDTDFATTTSGFQADIFESGLHRGPR